MKNESFDIGLFERKVFWKKNALKLLLSFSLKTLKARQVWLIYGSDKTNVNFLPPEKWDRGIVHKVNGHGWSGLGLKYFGPQFVRFKGISPVYLYKSNQYGEKIACDGIISFVLRKHKDFYKNGIKILLIDNIRDHTIDHGNKYSNGSILSYDGVKFTSLEDLKFNNRIVRLFKAKNFVSAYVPDYGAIVFNTMDEYLLEKNGNGFLHETELKNRLNALISAIEMASLAYIGQARGRQAAHLIWRKEKSLRKTALDLQKKEKELENQKHYLRAVGAVNEKQLNMEAVNISNGVYAFMDMVGSATIRTKFKPRDYFFILNRCHQIAANCSNRYFCRIDNFIGDAVFIQNASPFDDAKSVFSRGSKERLMLMIFTLASIFNEINQLNKGCHPLDTEGRIKRLVEQAKTEISFRAGLDIGTALIGPLGSDKRRIVTAIGKAVNNASRLECTGIKNEIHISKRVKQILDDAFITKDTKTILKEVENHYKNDRKKLNRQYPFIEQFQTIFKIKSDFMMQRNNVSYKEFSKDITYSIKCIPFK